MTEEGLVEVSGSTNRTMTTQKDCKTQLLYYRLTYQAGALIRSESLMQQKWKSICYHSSIYSFKSMPCACSSSS